MSVFGSFRHLFHLGFVVDDIPAAAERLAVTFGVHWTPVAQREMRLSGPDGSWSTELATCYTREGPVHLELIQAVPGTLWEMPAGVMTPHHVGVWCDDLRAESADLTGQELPLVATYDEAGQAVSGFAYHRMPDGTFLELLDSARKPAFDRWFAGGPHPGRPQAPAAG